MCRLLVILFFLAGQVYASDIQTNYSSEIYKTEGVIEAAYTGEGVDTMTTPGLAQDVLNSLNNMLLIADPDCKERLDLDNIQSMRVSKRQVASEDKVYWEEAWNIIACKKKHKIYITFMGTRYEGVYFNIRFSTNKAPKNKS